MTESDWDYTDENGLKCLIELFQNETDELTWKTGELTHYQVRGYGYHIAYDLIRELHAQKAEIEAHSKVNLKLSIQSVRFADKHSELADKFAGQMTEIERYRSALQEISTLQAASPIDDAIEMADIATKALEDKKQ